MVSSAINLASNGTNTPPGRYDPAPAASMLAAAWKSGTQIRELPTEIRPRTLDDGYDVQDSLIDQLEEPVVGWKLGIASRNAMRQASLDHPVAGRVMAARCHRSGDTVRVWASSPVTVEFEVAFVLSRDVLAGDAPVRPLDVVADMRVTFELLQSRFVDHRAAGIPSFAADNGAFQALVVGDIVDADAIDEVIRSVRVSVDGEERARARSGDDLIDPVRSLEGLLVHARRRGMTLHRGDIVSTGSLSKPFDVAGPGVGIVARFLQSELRARTGTF
jgi:2-keto-4-pentenoate hydratase